MRIKMLETRDGAEEGFRVSTFEKDRVLTVGEDITDDLAQEFLRAKLAEAVKGGDKKASA